MSSNINDFLASFKTDVARPNRFDVFVPIPIKLMAYYGTAKNLTFRCESAELPSVTFETLEQKIYGPTEKYPHQKNYNESTFTFMVSDDMSEKDFFDAWMELINPSSTYDFPYKRDYATEITVNQYDMSGEVSYSISLEDAFPVSVNQLDLDWSSIDSYHKLSVVFAYKSWANKSISQMGLGLLTAGMGDLTDLASGALTSLSSGINKNDKPFWDMTQVGSKIEQNATMKVRPNSGSGW
jgi:hypothetical protein